MVCKYLLPTQSPDCLQLLEGRLFLRLMLGHSPVIGLMLLHRGTEACFQLPVIHAGEYGRAELPDLCSMAAGRWDVWVHSGDDQQRVICREAPEQAKHFFSCLVNDCALSAYLTDSEKSLALFVDDPVRHKKLCASEDARQAYPRYLKELALEQNLVLFESFLGKAYAGNPRYIYERLLESYPHFRFVWAYNGTESIPGDPEIVHRGSPGYFRVLAQAGYRVNNIRFPVCGQKPETVYLQTWHGTPLKRLSFDIKVSGPEVQARDALYDESLGWSYLLSENCYSSEVLPRAFRYSGTVLDSGYPLTDALVGISVRKALQTSSLGLAQNRRYFLYAPTWRDNQAVSAWQHKFDLNLDLEQLSAAMPVDAVLLIKAHHLVSEKLNQDCLPDNIKDMSHVEDINDLCRIASVLITDYSSVFFDFAVTGRPIVFYCYDLEEYSTSTRGLYLDVHADLPGPVVQTTQDLVKCLQSLDQVVETYAASYAAFQERFCVWNDGHASERVVSTVFGVENAN